MQPKITDIIFDFGGVLIDWNPRYVYRTIFDKEEDMEWFLSNICTLEWNALQDAGRPFAEATKLLKEKYPEYSTQIEAYYSRFTEMIKSDISETVEVLYEIENKGYPVYGLTNWSAESFTYTYDRFKFLSTLKGIVVSGKEKLIKPDPRIYKVLLERYNLKAENCLFIDDSKANIEAASKLGFHAIHFTSPEQLRNDLKIMGVL